MPPLRRLLLTAFEPFGGLAVNPSWEAVRALDGEVWGRVLVRAVCLPVSYDRAPARLREEIETFRPAAVVMFGVAQNRREISLERQAANRCDASTRDNDGASRSGPIDPAGPANRESTLPLDRVKAALDRLGVPAGWSEDAGGYLCNRVFWEARSVFPGPAGFIHVPGFEAIPLAKLIPAVRAAAEAVAFEDVRLAAAQFAPVPGDVAANVRTIEEMSRRASGARLVLFPELATTGIAIPSAAVAARLAEPFGGPTHERLQAVARETGTAIGWGFVERSGRALYNSAAVVWPAADPILYRKRRLYGHDFNWACEGEGGGPYDTPLGRLGIAICHDVVYSDIAAEGHDCDLVLMPTNWIGDDGPAACLRAFQAPVLASDRTGEEDEIPFLGRGGLYNSDAKASGGNDLMVFGWKRVAI